MTRNIYNYRFTVCTATYNRAKLMHRVFDSLMRQTFKDFEWLIIDDGSTDNIQEIVEEFQKKSWFPIRYIYKENGGKHTAINRGVKEAKGELFLIFDSDDWCVENALERFDYHWKQIDNKEKFSSIASLSKDTNGNVIGQKFPKDIFDSNLIDIYFKYGVSGDKWILMKTDIMKKYPFKEFQNEKFIAESSVWHKIAKDYKTRFINEILLLPEYQPNGLSSDTVKLRKNSPCGSVYTYSQEMTFDIPLKFQIKAFINCIRFAIYNYKSMVFCIKRILFYKGSK